MARTGPDVLTPQERDFPQWYQDVLVKAELADNGPVRGTMVLRPYGFALWERVQRELDDRIKATGAENVYFPLFIPQSYIEREAEHVEGFSPELAVVTHAGGKDLAEPVVVRPTSETIFGEYMAKWVQSYRDLPLLLNQWANVVRWELRPRVFLRTSEFLWQEGHTAHASRDEAAAFARRIHDDVYAAFLRDVLALPVEPGLKTDAERFAGAIDTIACEVMMRDGKALQMATSHELGQGFARAFDMTYATRDGATEHCWTTSWGSSTRIVGGLIMGHGDDRGLRIPPRLAPVQAVVVPVRDEPATVEAAHRLRDELSAAGVRSRMDRDLDASLGRRLTNWELKGVPLRVQVGPRELAAGVAELVRRDDGSTARVALEAVAGAALTALDAAQADLARDAAERARARTHEVGDLDAAIEAAGEGFAKVPWSAVGEAGERRVNAAGVSVRCLQTASGDVPGGSDEPGLVAVVARSY